MTNDEILAVINEAAKNLPGHIALILVTDCVVTAFGRASIEVDFNAADVDDDTAEQIKTAVEDALQTLGHAKTLH